MSKFGKIFLGILLVLGIATFYIAITKNAGDTTSQRDNQVVVKTGMIEKKQLFSGIFEFSKTTTIKPRMNGMLQKIHKNVGDTVQIGDVLAEINAVIDPSNLENAKKQLRLAQINFQTQKMDFERQDKLYKKGIIAKVDFEKTAQSYHLVKEELKAAKDQLFIVNNGYATNSEKTNKVLATANGTILSVPISEGTAVVKRNDYGEGSTIASIGAMNDLRFNFYVTERELINLQQGMPLAIYVNALDSGKLPGAITKINYTSEQINNISKYLIEAKLDEGVMLTHLHSGFTGTSEIVLDSKQDIKLVEEKYVEFKEDSAFVQKIDLEGRVHKQFVKTGISDGVHIEIIEGLDVDDYILEQS